MKVLKNNYNNSIKEDVKTYPDYPRQTVCPNCCSELEYEKEDTRMGVLGYIHLDCPLCGESIMFEDDEDSITLTVDNIEFPIHFFHTSKETGAVDCCTNEKVKKYIHEAINFFRKNRDEYRWCVATGNLNIIVIKYDEDEEYNVIVTNNYYETYIPFEPKDY